MSFRAGPLPRAGPAASAVNPDFVPDSVGKRRTGLAVSEIPRHRRQSPVNLGRILMRLSHNRKAFLISAVMGATAAALLLLFVRPHPERISA